MKKAPILLLLTVVIFFASCSILEDAGKRSVVYLQVDNTRNCTDVVIEDPRTGKVLMIVEAGQMAQEEISAAIFDQQEETTLFAHTPFAISDKIMAGDSSVIPEGCRYWGTDTKRVRLRDGYDTVEFRVNLRPPSWWDDRGFWNELSLEEQTIIESFWGAQGVNLDVEVPETEVQLQ